LVLIVDGRPGPIQARFWLEWAEKPSPAKFASNEISDSGDYGDPWPDFATINR
jgi:hypothetical protein